MQCQVDEEVSALHSTSSTVISVRDVAMQFPIAKRYRERLLYVLQPHRAFWVLKLQRLRHILVTGLR